MDNEIESLVKEHETLFEQREFNLKLIDELMERNRNHKRRLKEIRDRLWKLIHENLNMVENGIRL